ncbi:hypothetical protein [Zunongwangia sp. HGR-M22]|uniref:hypothetical protein n=1 Tax=Zunongwangia sp. HGR-M22 TaxID=3015168 RepID=UPI0022DE7D4D|nr:hypothetical protein [Zunongwangia sp. HGR-M22]WBL27036.1 hypothetical protein PBT91_07130 [Zunongwangia sp. HGR-M22]
MKLLFKYISFFSLLLNGYGSLHANSLNDDTHSFSEIISFECDQDLYFDYIDDSDALIHQRSSSYPERKFSESEEIEIEEAQNETDADVSKKCLGSSDYLATLFYTVLSAYHDFNRSDSTPYFSNEFHQLSYPSLCVRYCVFRI